MNAACLLSVLTVLGGCAVISATAADIEDATPTPAPILSTEISGRDLGFFMGAAPEIALLMQLADLAKTHAVTPEVQAEAATVLKEQTAAAGQFKQLAERDHIPLSDSPDDAGGNVVADLRKLDGVKFDKAFLDALGDAQDGLETALNTGASSADPDIKSFATANLQTLKQERDRIRKLGL
jgi:predicted outer membrane protein